MSSTSTRAALQTVGANDPLDVHREKIGDREYAIEELTAYRFLALGDLITEQAEALGGAGLLNMEAFKELDKGDFSGLITKVRKLWKDAPQVVGRFFALVLSGEQEDDPDYILKHLKLFTQLPRVLMEFMRVNPWRDLVDSFFQIGQQIRGAAGPSGDLEEAQEGKPSTSSR